MRRVDAMRARDIEAGCEDWRRGDGSDFGATMEEVEDDGEGEERRRW
jgi:hypothetical protein